jgi:uncharacterized damage-inducible protein DinB
MSIDDLRTLLDYHYWARDRVLDAAEALPLDHYTRDVGSSFRSVRDTLVHTYSAEWVWHSRWRGTSPTVMIPFAEYPDISTLRSAWAATERDVRAVLEEFGEAGLDRRIEYRLLSGQAGASQFRHMLQHVVNHATYHRGQVTTLLRQLGAAAPPSTDLIAFYRERGL